MSDDRKPIGYVTATVQFPLYEGDRIEGASWDWFEYRQAELTEDGRQCVVTRDCKLIQATVTLGESA
jgi:hypothetical protein